MFSWKAIVPDSNDLPDIRMSDTTRFPVSDVKLPIPVMVKLIRASPVFTGAIEISVVKLCFASAKLLIDQLYVSSPPQVTEVVGGISVIAEACDVVVMSVLKLAIVFIATAEPPKTRTVKIAINGRFQTFFSLGNSISILFPS